jgi:hypothetical protein
MLSQASRGGSLAMLEWLLTVTAPWSTALKTRLLKSAGWCNSFAAAKWLIAQGAEWPPTCAGGFRDIHSALLVHQCWSLPAVQWAVASGSGWLDWHCQDNAEAKFTQTESRKHAAAAVGTCQRLPLHL